MDSDDFNKRLKEIFFPDEKKVKKLNPRLGVDQLADETLLFEIPAISTKRPRSSEAETGEDRLNKLLKKAPSSLTNEEVFRKTAGDFVKMNRPFERHTIPIELLDPHFGKFKDNCSVPPEPWSQELLLELTSAACQWYDSETDRRSAILDVLNKSGIQMAAETINHTEYKTDGNCRVVVMPAAIRECKTTTGINSAVFQSVGYYAQFLNNAKKKIKQSRFPCVLFVDTGTLFGLYGCIWTGKYIHVEPLTPVYDLTCHSTDEISRDAIASVWNAFKETIRNLESYYDTLVDPPITINLTFPYPTSYVDETDQVVNFTYLSRIEGNLVFTAQTNGDPKEKICIKFTRRYSETAHRLLADHGYTPQLRRVVPRPGNWLQVVMDYSNYAPLSDAHLNSDEQEKVRSSVQRIVQVLHKNDIVHGDIREVNILIDKETLSVQLIDFDWAGTDGQARYPRQINTKSVRRPHGASDGKLITKEHDTKMVDFLFDVPIALLMGN
ncbi:hypothetical protein ACEPAF_1113 [Sanghuangporus sanghuang]